MATHALKPWTELVHLHPDVESGSLAEAVFAIDLGAISAGDKATPLVYRDANAFFGATYVTTDLQRMLEEVLSSLAGKGTYNRVLKLRSPFGGGKSHTLASLLHAARSRKSLNQIDSCKSLPDPGRVSVAVFDGEKFTATGDKDVGNGQAIHTMWGWLAWQLGPKAYKTVNRHDTDRVSPAGDEIKAMLEAEGTPVLLLLDEVLKYMERAAAVQVQESTLQRQAKDFIQNLTVEVANSTNAVMVYSLQWSAREALGNVALLEELDKLTSRKDQVREPVTGDEVLAVVKRRLLAGEPDDDAGKAVAREYSDAIGKYLSAQAETQSAKQEATEHAIELKGRMQAAYPFHPSLIDLMNSRWTSVDGFQRTRGALRFLASCLHGLKKNGGAKPLLGPGDIPLTDADVMRAMLKDLDPRQDYSPAMTHDIVGPSARAKRIDDRRAKETPALANVRPAQRLATAIMAYSFGGLKREEGASVLPPGVIEADLLEATIGPDLDSITASAVLGDLRKECLYLHFDGVRYCFKKDANVTKLIEDAEQEVARDPNSLREHIKGLFESRLAGKNDAIIWPETSQDLPDKEPAFLTGYLPLEFASHTATTQEEEARTLLSKHGDAPRTYRNGIALAIPDRKPIEALRRAVRYLMAVDKVEAKKKQHKLTKDQEDQLRERKRTEETAAETAFRQLYSAVWLPRVGNGGAIQLEKIEVGGRPLQATGIHERVMELLTTVGTPKIHNSLHPRKVIERVKLGESLSAGEPARLGVSTKDVRDAFFGFLDPPRITSSAVLRKAIVRGVQDGDFAYTTGTPSLGPDGKYQISSQKVCFRQAMAEDEVDLDGGFLFVPAAVPIAAPIAGSGELSEGIAGGAAGTTKPASGNQPPTGGSVAGSGHPQKRTCIRISYTGSRDDVFKSFPAIANLADKSDGSKINITVEGQCEAGFEKNWFRNAVQEPLDEAGINGLAIE